ncbi:hypothetical protein ACN94_06720 [Gordonia paraffinivorans]|uniref:hypothetical protein n=1 Tax=Gordonia paraffinivorans TaxID=175628 RepID=UPI000D61F690|nr:hypothetical protein [Gordonia paraffinivorans]MBY4573281.1 hypothetical protein [Gordonia paraffinivorans]PWD41262.1 hypothetical protein ACN93_20750 [Gordonia paraffinivorans]
MGRFLKVGSDGTIRLPSRSDLLHRAYVPGRGPRVVFSITLTHRLLDPGLLGRIIAEHSATWPHITVLASDEHVYAQRVVECAVFNRVNIGTAYAEWSQFVDEQAPLLMELLNPGGHGAHSCRSSVIPVGLQTLVELDNTGPRLTPERVVHLTNCKVDRLRDYLRACNDLAEQYAAEARDLEAVGAERHEVEVEEAAARYFASFADLLGEAIALITG